MSAAARNAWRLVATSSAAIAESFCIIGRLCPCAEMIVLPAAEWCATRASQYEGDSIIAQSDHIVLVGFGYAMMCIASAPLRTARPASASSSAFRRPSSEAGARGDSPFRKGDDRSQGKPGI